MFKAKVWMGTFSCNYPKLFFSSEFSNVYLYFWLILDHEAHSMWYFCWLWSSVMYLEKCQCFIHLKRGRERKRENI